MRHRIDDVVEPKAVSESGHFFGIFGEVCMFPGVPDVHIEVDGDGQAATRIIEGSPMRRDGLRLDYDGAARSSAKVAQSGDVSALIDVVEHVKERISLLDFQDLLAGEHTDHGVAKSCPIVFAMKVVYNQEATAEKVVAEACAFALIDVPVGGLGGVDPGMIENAVVGNREMVRFTGVDAGEAADALGKVSFGLGHIDHPPLAGKEATNARTLGVFDANEVELGFGREIGAGFIVAAELGEGSGSQAQDCKPPRPAPHGVIMRNPVIR